MATILAVDDRAINREFLATLLSYCGHEVLQAADGAAALALVRARRPDLVITDVLMPIMDGVEFADRVHDDPDIAQTPIIFYTATYRLPQAKLLGDSCRVVGVLAKPAEPQQILDMVGAALGTEPAIGMVPEAVAAHSNHRGPKLPAYIRDLTEAQRRLAHARNQATGGEAAAPEDADGTLQSFHSLSLRLATLLEFDLTLASERNAQLMVELLCRASQDILGCKYAAVGILDNEGHHLQYWATRGLEDEAQAQFVSIDPIAGIFGSVIASGKPFVAQDKNGLSAMQGLPRFHPAVNSLLVVPIPVRSSTSVHGWLYLAEKLGSTSFEGEDEQFAVTLAAQFALTFGNLTLYDEIQQHAAKLEVEVRERRRAQEELAHRMTHDQTTGLPRFELLEEYLQAAFVSVAARKGRVLVLYVDVDHFHAVNETRGRSVGDHVLRTIAERLTAVAGDAGKVAHVASDEFAVVLLDDAAHDRVAFAEAVRSRAEEPIPYEEQRIYVTCSVGVSCFPENGGTPEELLRQAEAAMLRAKRDGRNTVSVFSNDQKQEMQDRKALGVRLHDAIRNNELVLHYQPLVDGQNWQILGFEALVRWQSPEFGLLPPGRFLHVAEELGLIIDIGRFVLDTVCRQVRAWIDSGANDFFVSINVSALQLQRPDFVEEVSAALSGWELPARHIDLELTESMMTENVERVIGTMRALKALGVRLSLDDFGTGYSSLNYLRQFPIDTLKIDQNFVRDIGTDTGAAGICRAIIALGHQLGMTVLAEGVETAAQVGYLRRNDCDRFQGFYFSKPVTPTQALVMLRHQYVTPPDLTQQQKVHRLLLVDGDENTLRTLGRTLLGEGYRIFTAKNTDDALDALARNHIHVILADQDMAQANSIEFLRKSRKMYPGAVRVVLTGHADLAAAVDAVNDGLVDKLLTKPWDDDDLCGQIREAFRRHASRAVVQHVS